MNKRLRRIVAALIVELLDGEETMSTRTKLLLVNAALLAALIGVLSCTYDASIHSDFRYRLPASERAPAESSSETGAH